MPYYTYILECSDKTLYTGWTNHLEKRIETHNSGKWAKYTHGRLPVRLIYSEDFDAANDARKREYAIKKLTKIEKIELIKKNPR